MKTRFEPDVDSGARPIPPIQLIDPEAYDASEPHFAASVEEKPAARFVMDGAKALLTDLTVGDVASESQADRNGSVAELSPETSPPAVSLQTDLLELNNSGSWRNEVADRVNNYRARRRPRQPRYPSLQLKFDAPEPSWTTQKDTTQVSIHPAPGRITAALRATAAVPEQGQLTHPEADEPSAVADSGARILEFPRSAVALPVFDELAEPVMDRPRILEVPEFVLPPPALGGILMDAVEEPAQERRPGLELPLQAAPMSRRLLAGAMDSLLVLTAFAVFAYIFFRITSIAPALQVAAGLSATLIALFWSAYQYLLLVHTGTTPGLKLARLQLSRFDGTAVPGKIRRWRVLASMLSGLSLALGYAWCFLDEDRLCWHDRITRTYMAPLPAKSSKQAG
jgi:uncharacterized RDD family membrane protein YckC